MLWVLKCGCKHSSKFWLPKPCSRGFHVEDQPLKMYWAPLKMRSKKFWHLKSCFFFSPLNFSCFSFRSESFSALISFPVNEILKEGCFALLSPGSSHHLPFGEWPQREECKTHYVLVSCCEQIETELAFVQLSPSSVCFPRFAFLAPSDVVGSVLFTGKLCLQTFVRHLKMQI